MMRKFDHQFLAPVDLERDDRETGRVYIDKDGYEYRSVTSVLSRLSKGAIDRWKARVGEEEARRVSTKAKLKGTAFHSICEKYLLNDSAYMDGAMPYLRQDFKKIQPFLDRNIGCIYGIEHRLASKPLNAAGTADLIAVWKNQPAIIDFKTSKRVKSVKDIGHYFIQCTAYSMMVEETYGFEVPKMVIIMSVDGDKPLVFERDCDPFRDVTRKFFK